MVWTLECPSYLRLTWCITESRFGSLSQGLGSQHHHWCCRFWRSYSNETIPTRYWKVSAFRLSFSVREQVFNLCRYRLRLESGREALLVEPRVAANCQESSTSTSKASSRSMSSSPSPTHSSKSTKLSTSCTKERGTQYFFQLLLSCISPLLFSLIAFALSSCCKSPKRLCISSLVLFFAMHRIGDVFFVFFFLKRGETNSIYHNNKKSVLQAKISSYNNTNRELSLQGTKAPSSVCSRSQQDKPKGSIQ